MAQQVLSFLRSAVWPSSSTHSDQRQPLLPSKRHDMCPRHRKYSIDDLRSTSPELDDEGCKMHYTVTTKRQRPQNALTAPPPLSKFGEKKPPAAQASPGSVLCDLVWDAAPSTGWSKASAVLYVAYRHMVHHRGFFDDDCPSLLGNDRWNVAHGAQAMAHAAGILTQDQRGSTSDSFYADLAYEQRVKLAACLCLSMKFQRQAGMAHRMSIRLPDGMRGPAMIMASEVALTYECFLSPTEQCHFRSAQRSAHALLQKTINWHILALVSSVDCSFRLLGRNVLCAAEETLWKALHTKSHCVPCTQSDVLRAMAVAGFSVDSASRAFPVFVFEKLPPSTEAQRASGLAMAALAACCGVHAIESVIDVVASSSNEEALVQSALDFLHAVLSAPATDARRGAVWNDEPCDQLSRASLLHTRCKLEAYKARSSVGCDCFAGCGSP